MRAVLLCVDNCVKSGMFRCDCLGMGLVHRSISFRWLTRDNCVNKSRFDSFVASETHGSASAASNLPMTGEKVTARRACCRMSS